MKRMLMTKMLFAMCLMALCPISVNAATGKFFSNVKRVVSDNDKFGGCMALLTVAPSSVGLECNGKFVSFSCTGDFASKDEAKRNFELTQIAMLVKSRVQIVVDDTKKHNGYCFANRIDLETQ